MRKIYATIIALFAVLQMSAQGWPADYKGVMLQGFAWDSYVDTQWDNLKSQADEISEFFNLIWVPNSGNCNSEWNNMGYMPVYYYNHNSSFGSQAQLCNMIKTYKQRNVGIIADVVINHRNNIGNNGSWVDFPVETYNGEEWTMTSTDITKNDDGGKTNTWATQNGYSLSNNYDTGEDWSGCRDLDHKSENVQKNVINYLKFLKNDLGYIGYRYDMTKGYAASYTANYNNTVGAQYSVGEYWDGNVEMLKTWLNNTKIDGVIQSATFDFKFRYSVRDACNYDTWNKLGEGGLNNVDNNAYSRYAVTFIENHDTQYRNSNEKGDPITKNIEAGNAFLLIAPGTPCVFLPHWKQYKEEIKQMIYIRKLLGISNSSKMLELARSNAYYIVRTSGEDNKYALFIGGSNSNYDTTGTTLVASGNSYKIYVSNNVNQAWADKPSGTYGTAIDVTITSINDANATQLVYTTDGSVPTANSEKIESGKSITINKDMVLKVGILVNNDVKGIITRNYTIKPFEAHTATVYVKDPSWENMYFYAWDNTSSNKQLLGSWPGTKMVETKDIGEEKWFYKSFDINTEDYSFNIIFNQGSGKRQTVDIGPITSDKYYVLNNETSGKFTVTDVTDQYATDIKHLIEDNAKSSALPTKVYSINGKLLRSFDTMVDNDKATKGLASGLYIVNGKKKVVDGK